jgi:molybdopterin synthase catalytic subunit
MGQLVKPFDASELTLRQTQSSDRFMSQTVLFELTDHPINTQALRSQLLNSAAGAFVSFEGWVRNHHQGKIVSCLTYSAHAVLANTQGQKVLQQALFEFPGIQCSATHRLGELGIGDIAVWVGVCSAHRDQAFAACRYIIDAIKADVPIWKHEQYPDAKSAWLHPI